MNIKVLWTNYKIYGIIIGIVLGTIIYNMFSVDFSFLYIDNVKEIDFIDSYLFLLMNFLKFYVLIVAISFFKIKEKVYAFLLGVESFQLAGSIVILIKLHNIICFSGGIEALFKIAVILLFMRNERMVLNKIFAMIILLLGAVVENFLINFL